MLRNINRDHLIEFFQTLYRPENIIVSVVGDVSHEEALGVVEEAFGALPVGQLIKEESPSLLRMSFVSPKRAATSVSPSA